MWEALFTFGVIFLGSFVVLVCADLGNRSFEKGSYINKR
jgi:hypothetical protein